MKLVMTLSIMLMTTAVFAQQKRSMRAHVGDRTQSVERIQVAERSPHMHSAIKGIVRMNDKACGLHIEVPGDGGAVNVYPVNLPENFKVDGKSILFDYGQVDPKFTPECATERSVMVSNVKPRRTSL
ncbi:MAG: hypothetical protein ACJASQ_003159 [Crocinitomicaceae bacterium]|jgi:hypothetical protein